MNGCLSTVTHTRSTPNHEKRELKLNAKRLEKAESFASGLEAELQRVAGDGVNFETFVVLRRENQALKTQLAELKQARAGGQPTPAKTQL